MALTLAQLLQAKTADDLVAVLLAEFAAPPRSFPVTDWLEGSVARTLVETFAEVLSDFSSLAVLITKGGLLEEATGDYLTLLCRSNFNIVRDPATFAEHAVRLSAAAAAGPYTIAAGDLTALTGSGLVFTNIDGGTLSPSGTLDLIFKAESPGTAYNVSTNAINKLGTPLAGVTVTQSQLDAPASDEEVDDALRARALLQWSTLALGPTADTFKSYALAADADVRRVKVEENTPAAGGVRVTIARELGAATSGDQSTVDDYLQARRPLCVSIATQLATEVNVDIDATVYVKSANRVAAEAQINAEIDEAYRTDIGGPLFFAQVVEILMRPTGVINAVLTDPPNDVALTAYQVPTKGTVSLTMVEV